MLPIDMATYLDWKNASPLRSRKFKLFLGGTGERQWQGRESDRVQNRGRSQGEKNTSNITYLAVVKSSHRDNTEMGHKKKCDNPLWGGDKKEVVPEISRRASESGVITATLPTSYTALRFVFQTDVCIAAT
jgi:hypothetical protein